MRERGESGLGGDRKKNRDLFFRRKEGNDPI